MFLQDTYTDTVNTLLTDHDPDVGDAESWEEMAFSTGGGGSPVADAIIITGNLLGTTTTTGQAHTYRNNTDPGSDEYDIETTWSFRNGAQANRFHWVCFRMTPTGTADGDVDRYMFFGNSTSGQQWELYKVVSGTLTLLDSAAGSLSGNQFDILIEVRNGSISCSVDDGGGFTEVVSSNDTDITQRGRVGVGIARGNDGNHWADNLVATAVGAATPVTASVSHGLILSHQIEASLVVDVDASISHGLSLNHQVTANVAVAGLEFLSDTFTDTNGTLLEDHDPELGGTWEKLGFAITGTPGSDLLITSNELVSNGSVGTTASQSPTHRNDVDPGGDEYDIECTMQFHTLASAQRFVWVAWRMSPTGTASSAVDRYILVGDSSTVQQWRLFKVVSGTLTELDNEDAVLSSGEVFNVRVEVRETGATSSVYINDELTLFTHDTSITQRGRVGVGVSRQNQALDNLVCTVFSIPDFVEASVSHGLALGHEVTADIVLPAQAEITHGLSLGHQVTAYSDASITTDFDGDPFSEGWAVDSPLGGETVDVFDSRVHITVPDTQVYDTINSTSAPDNSAGIIRSIVGPDIDVAVQFDTDASNTSGLGLTVLVKGDTEDDICRFTMYSTATVTSLNPLLYGFQRANGEGSSSGNSSFSGHNTMHPSWLRVKYVSATGTWTCLTSLDGVNWTTRHQPVREFTPTRFKVSLSTGAAIGATIRIQKVVDVLSAGTEDLRDPVEELTASTVLVVQGTDGALPSELTDDSLNGGSITWTGTAMRLTQDLDTDQSRARVEYTGPTVADNCGALALVQHNASGSQAFFAVGFGQDTGDPSDQYSRGPGYIHETAGSNGRRVLRVDPAGDKIGFEGPYGFLQTGSSEFATVGNRVWIRIERIGRRVRSKDWLDGQPEPETWNRYDGQDQVQEGPYGLGFAYSHNDGATQTGTRTLDIYHLEFYQLASSAAVEAAVSHGLSLSHEMTGESDVAPEVAIRQSATNAADGPVAAEFPLSIVQGSLLIAVLFSRGELSGSPEPSFPLGWSVEDGFVRLTQVANTSARRGLAVATRIAGAEEPRTVEADWVGGMGTANRQRLSVFEFTTNGVVPKLEDVVSNDNGTNTNASTISTGTTGIIGVTNTLKVGVFGGRMAAGSTRLRGTSEWTESLDGIVNHSDASDNTVATSMAWAIDPTTGSKSAIATTDPVVNTNTGLSAGLLVFSTESTAPQVEFDHGLTLSHQVVVGASSEVQVSHGLSLDHQVEAEASSSIQVTHGLSLSHSMTIELPGTTTSIQHGLSLTHSVQVEQEANVSVVHSLSLSHQVGVNLGQTNSVQINHGLSLGHQGLVLISFDFQNVEWLPDTVTSIPVLDVTTVITTPALMTQMPNLDLSTNLPVLDITTTIEE